MCHICETVDAAKDLIERKELTDKEAMSVAMTLLVHTALETRGTLELLMDDVRDMACHSGRRIEPHYNRTLH